MGKVFGISGGNPTPPPLPLPPPLAHPSVLGSTQSAAINQAQKAAAAQGSGSNNTVATSPQGLKEKATTANATLLGQ